MITLRPMTEEEFSAYKHPSMEAYALERSRNFDTPVEEERRVATRQFAQLLKDGLRTEGQLLWKVTVTGTGEVVGSLWVYVDGETAAAFIYDINIDRQQRGKGYGGATLTALERELRSMGVTRIGLNVFADNSVAMGLYRRQGYKITNYSMQKRL